MNKMNSDLHADEALTGMSDRDTGSGDGQKKPTGTALVAVPASSLTGVDRDPREEVWSVLHNAKRTEAEVPRTWRKR